MPLCMITRTVEGAAAFLRSGVHGARRIPGILSIRVPVFEGRDPSHDRKGCGGTIAPDGEEAGVYVSGGLSPRDWLNFLTFL